MQKLMSKRSKSLDRLVKYTVATILIAIPLYPKFPFIRIPGTFVAVRLEDLVLVFSFFLLTFIYSPKLNELVKSKLNASILVFLLVGFVSVFSAVFLTKTVVPHIGFLHWLRRIEYFVPLFLGIEAIKRQRQNLHFYLKILTIVMIVAFIYGFGEKYFEWPIIITQNEEYSKGVALRWVPGSHINSTFAGHYDLASYLVLTLPLIAVSSILMKGRYSKMIAFLTFLCGMWLLVNTASRISLASFVIAVFLSLILAHKYKFIPIFLIISFLFTIFSSNLVSRYSNLIEVAKENLQRFNLLNYVSPRSVFAQETALGKKRSTPTPTLIPVFEDRSTNIRLNAEWPRAMRALSKNPLLGTGYSSITLATDNDYLRLLGEAGILGFMAFLSIFLRIGEIIIKKLPLYKNFKNIELAFSAGMVGSLSGIFINATFIDLFEASKFAITFWLFIGMVIALFKYENSTKKS